MYIIGKTGLFLEVLQLLVLLTKLLSGDVRGLEVLSSVIQIAQSTKNQTSKKNSHLQHTAYSSVFITNCLELTHWKSVVGLCLVIKDKPRFKITFINTNKECTALRA